MIGVDASHRGLVDGAGAAFQYVRGHTQNELEAQRVSLGTLRGEFSQDAVTIAQYLADAQ